MSLLGIVTGSVGLAPEHCGRYGRDRDRGRGRRRPSGPGDRPAGIGSILSDQKTGANGSGSESVNVRGYAAMEVVAGHTKMP